MITLAALPLLLSLPATQPPSLTHWPWDGCVITGPASPPLQPCGHLWDFDYSATVDLRDVALMQDRWQCSADCGVFEWRAGE